MSSSRPARAGAARAADGWSNVALWAAFAVIVLGTSGYFLAAVYSHLGWDLALALVTLVVRTVLFTALGLFFEAVLLRSGEGYLTENEARRSVLHAYWIGIMLVSVALMADVLVYAFAGYHVPTGLRILLSDGLFGVIKVVDATGLSPSVVGLATLGLALGLGIAIVLSKWSRRLSHRAGIVVSRRQAARASLVSVGALALVEMAGYRLRDPFLWEKEVREIPLAFSIVRPEAELAAFRISVERSAPRPHNPGVVEQAAPARRPDVFIVIIESLRADAVAPDVMPHLADFAKRASTFEHAVTTGNVTHYSWYGLLCGRVPLYFDVVKHSREQQGSAALAALREAGYRVHLLTTPDTTYQNLENIVFGAGRAGKNTTLLDDKFRPAAPEVARRDQLVIAELNRRLTSTHAGGSVYVVALDSPHFGYQWGSGFTPRFVPYASDISITKDYAHSASLRLAVINRYRNSVAWVDSLLGSFFEALERSNRRDDSIIVVTGDHGEAFWEHGSGTHGSDLGAEQLDVGFAMKLPGAVPRRKGGVFSLLDVMPTVLYAAGIRGVVLDGTSQQEHDARSASDGNASQPAGGAFTFQGWNERAYRFMLTNQRRRLLFELDSVDPLKAQRLVLKDAFELDDGSPVGRGKPGMSYEAVIAELPAAVAAMHFLRVGSR
jgi:arylsulfatase A-like enzyme